MTEEWRPIVGFEGWYEVSDQGRVRSLDRQVRIAGRWGPEVRTYEGKVLRQYWMGTSRYLGVALSRNSKVETHPVHRLVLEAFTGARPDGGEARHLNCINSDNRSSNLVWGSRSDNREDSRENGSLAVGERIAQHKLTEAQVIAIRKSKVKSADVAAAHGVSVKQIGRVRRKENWRHV